MLNLETSLFINQQWGDKMAEEKREPDVLPKHSEFRPTLPNPGVMVKDAKPTKKGRDK